MFKFMKNQKAAEAKKTSAGDNDLDRLITSIRDDLEKLHVVSENCCISAIPHKIRRFHEEAFSPKLFCIGPFHQGKQSKAMGNHKLRYLESFLGQEPNRLDDCVVAIKKLEHRIRYCYSEKIDLKSNDFIRMVLVDGAFIIELFLRNQLFLKNELFLRNCFSENRAANDIIFNQGNTWVITQVRRDLSLMENQLPFFVLEDLFSFTSETPWREYDVKHLLKLAYDFFDTGANLTAEWERISKYDVKHLLDALRFWHLSAKTKKGRHSQSTGIQGVPQAKQLRAAGVKFRENDGSNCLFDIEFSKGGELKIPRFKLFPEIESLLRNMMAFEYTCYRNDSDFIDYVALLGDLIHTKADAKLLIKKQIIHIGDWLGHDETMARKCEALVNLFNSFGNERQFRTKSEHFCKLRQDLKTYRRTPLHTLKFSMKGNSLSKKKHHV